MTINVWRDTTFRRKIANNGSGIKTLKGGNQVAIVELARMTVEVVSVSRE